MKNISKVDFKNLHRYYNQPDGNLYWFNEAAGRWELVDSFNEFDCIEAMANGVQFVFVDGPAVSCFKIN